MNFRILLLLLHLVSGFYDTHANSTELQSGDKCVLPPKPDNGFYLTDGKNMTPGTLVDEYSILYYQCNEGYKRYSEKPNQETTLCFAGSWVSEIQCIKYVDSCSNIVTNTLDLTCFYGDDVVDCDGTMHNRIRVALQCKQYHSKVQPMRMLRCFEGNWIGDLPYCEPICGDEKPDGQQFIVGSELNDRKVPPWQVGVYRLIKNKYVYKCGGTIVSNKVVITAAHCFDAGNGTIDNFEEYRIAAGKVFRDWDHDEINDFAYIQRNEIEALKIHYENLNYSRLMKNDIAVVIVKGTFVFSDDVHPACVELYYEEFYKNLLVHGNQGKVFRWDTTEKENQSSVGAQMKEALVPVVDKESCRDGIFFNFTTLGKMVLMANKFCAGFNISGPTFCNEDNGSGFLMDIKEKGLTKWYLMGVLSVVPIEDTKTGCSKTSFVPFLQVATHIDFIKSIMTQYQ